MVTDVSKKSMPRLLSLDRLILMNIILCFKKSKNIYQSILHKIPEDLNSSGVNDLRQNGTRLLASKLLVPEDSASDTRLHTSEFNYKP
jgi:hypothetical protein